jgi:hypothetical protein
MKNTKYAWTILIATFMLVVSSAVAQEEMVPSVPQFLQGDWLVLSKPNTYSSPGMQLSDTPAITFRMDAINYVYRMRKDPSLVGALDETGKPLKLVTDEDGKEYFEQRPFFISIRTNSVPWQIDLWRKASDGSLIKLKGICSLQKDTLTSAG